MHYVVWCGVQSGKVSVRIGRPRSSGPVGFSHRAQVHGVGATGSLRCRTVSGEEVLCVGRKTGPATIRGTVTFSPGPPCETPVRVGVRGWTGGSVSTPIGCSNSYHERARSLGQIISERAYCGFDRDLDGNRRAIVRRAKRLQRAWRRGDPVARWTSMEEVFRMPMRAREQAELEYRETYREHFQDLFEGWVAKHAAGTFAGYELDEEHGGLIYVGFTVEPEATLARLKRHLIAPDRFRPFPTPPTHTERELEHLAETIWQQSKSLFRLINSTSVDVLANKVEVGTEHVARVKKLIAKRYGAGAPFEVVFARPAVPL